MPRRLRQCYLGPYPQQTLCLIPRPPGPPPDALGKCYIDILPVELLVEIMTYLAPEIDLYEPPTYEQCPPVALVCKHWERSYDAVLYRNIVSCDQSVWHQRRNAKVIETLRQQADLRNHVRKIAVQRWHPSEATCHQIGHTIKSCPATRTVLMSLAWSTKVWPIIHAVGKLPHLEVLRLSAYADGPSLKMILGHFNQPTLRELGLCRYGLGKGDAPMAPWVPIEPPSQDQIDKLSVIACSSSSGITSLKLDDPSCSPHCTSILLTRFSKLVRLSLSHFTLSRYGFEYKHDALELVLSVHRETLQYIRVGFILNTSNEDGTSTVSGIPDFSKFQCLRELHLSAYNILAEKPCQAAAKLATPVLRHLTMSFSTEEEYSESWREFAEDEVLWMADFASQKPIGESNTWLQRVFVDFIPNCYIWVLDENETTTWPWDYLQQAEKELLRYNITMGCSKPSCTRDEWDQMVGDCRIIPQVEHDSQQIVDDLQALDVGGTGGQV